MKLSTFTDYSLRVLIFLASRPEKRATIAEIAQTFEISESHLVKVVHFLVMHHWLASVRGRGGGITLAKPPAQIVIGHVVRDAEGPTVPAECFDRDSNSCSLSRVCGLRSVMAEAVAAFQAVLDRYTLQDLMRNRGEIAQVLFFQRKEAAP